MERDIKVEQRGSPLPWGWFVLPPLVPLTLLGRLYVADSAGIQLNPHGLDGLSAVMGQASIPGVILLNAVLVPWAVWRLATGRSEPSFKNILVVVFSVLVFVPAIWALRQFLLGR